MPHGQSRADVLRAFGDVGAQPTLLVFDQRGKAAGAYYGSTRQLHEEADAPAPTSSAGL